MSGLTTFHTECQELMKDAKLFPIEVDLTRHSFQYKSTMPVVQPDEDEDDEDEEADESLIETGQEALTMDQTTASMDLLGLQGFDKPPPDLLSNADDQDESKAKAMEDGTANLLGF